MERNTSNLICPVFSENQIGSTPLAKNPFIFKYFKVMFCFLYHTEGLAHATKGMNPWGFMALWGLWMSGLWDPYLSPPPSLLPHWTIHPSFYEWMTQLQHTTLWFLQGMLTARLLEFTAWQQSNENKSHISSFASHSKHPHWDHQDRSHEWMNSLWAVSVSLVTNLMFVA